VSFGINRRQANKTSDLPGIARPGVHTLHAKWHRSAPYRRGTLLTSRCPDFAQNPTLGPLPFGTPIPQVPYGIANWHLLGRGTLPDDYRPAEGKNDSRFRRNRG
jgi:hypothetical protein